MNDATRLAIAILILVIAFVLYFFSFHPNGVQNVNNPRDMLQWLMAQYKLASTTGSGEASGEPAGTGSATGQVLPSPTGKPLPGDLSKYFKG